MLKKFINKSMIKNFIILFSVCILTIVPFFNIIVNGVYSWHIKQPEFYQGGSEIIIFMVLAFILSLKFSQKKEILIFIIAGVYLSFNGVILPTVVVYIFFEIICYIGNVVLSINNKKYSNNISNNFISGVSIWGFFAIICSLLKLGTINSLRILTIILLIFSLIIDKHKSYKPMLIRFYYFIKENSQDKISNLLIIVLIFFILMLFAKTNTAIDYDSLWYGLRPEHVLVGEHSFYDYLGFSAFVYYYPKLMEVLFLPISNLGDYSFIISGNIFILILFINSFYKLIENSFRKISFSFKIAFTIAVFSIPAIANIATTAKPDILGAFFIFLSFIYFVQYIETKDVNNLIFFILSFILSTGTKLTYILWGGLLILSVVIILIYDYIKGKRIILKSTKSIENINYYILLSGIFFILGIHYRTYKLTGYPLYPIGLDLFNKIGFNSIYPAKQQGLTTLNPPFDISNIINRLYEFVINPNELSKVIMLWTSSFLIILFMIRFLLIQRNKINFTLKTMSFMLISIIQGMVMIKYMVSMPDPDGNYFILPIVVLLYICMDSIINIYIIDKSIHNGVILIAGTLIISMNIIITFVSHPSWATGTKKFTNEIIKNNFETKRINEESYIFNGFSKIADYINKDFKNRRIIASYIDLTIINRLDAPIETFSELSLSHFSNEDIMSNYNEFLKYIKHANIEGFILLNNDNSKFREYVNQLISKYGYEIKIEDENAIFYKINDISSITNDFKTTKLLNGYIYSDMWTSREIHLRMNTLNGVLKINGYTELDILPNGISIYINNKEIDYKKITKKTFSINIDTGIKNDIVDVKIIFDRAIVPKNLGINDDLREISFILEKLYFE